MNTPITIDEAWEKLSNQLNHAELFFGHGAVDADSEALWILAHCLDVSPSSLLTKLEQSLPLTVLEKASQLVTTRIYTRKPLAYLLGEAWLMGEVFDCDERSIVPRSFIAELISNQILDPWLPAAGRALDLCTGNASLAILLAKYCPDLEITATDIDPKALELARQNIAKFELTDAIELYCGDVWNALDDPNDSNRFDLILCNPPYVNSATMSTLPPEYLAEPRHALAGGLDGMDFIGQVLARAKEYLTDRGVLVLEIGNEYAHFQRAFPDLVVLWLEVAAGNTQVGLMNYADLP